MGFEKIEKDNRIDKIITTLKRGGKSNQTIENYSCSINRFLNFFYNKNIEKLTEEEIMDYIEKIYLSANCSANTYNLNICAIKYFYSISYNRELNNKLLPHSKLTKKLPSTIDRETFIKIFEEEKFLRHKCWPLLGYCSGLRVEEISKIKIDDIYSQKHKLKVLGKRKKERFTILPDITIQYLRLYYKKFNYNSISKSEYLFRGYKGSEHTCSRTITNYFTTLKKRKNLDENITFHSLRHSFASNFIKNGGDPFVLKSMMGHTSMSTTSIYIHVGRDFNNLKGVNYNGI